jgi:hypothetical protein
MFYIEHQTDEFVYIIDTGITEPSVREDARNVVEFLYKSHNLGNRRLISRNYYGNIYEIKHKKGAFIALSIGHSGIDLPPESEDFKECMQILGRLREMGNPTEKQSES